MMTVYRSWLAVAAACIVFGCVQAAAAPRIIILLGPPGAGKTTQAEFISKAYKLPTVSAAELARHEVGKKGDVRKSLKVGLANGAILTDQLLNQLVVDRIRRGDAADGFVLDGYPRNLDTAKYFDGILEQRGAPVQFVIYLEASDETVMERMEKRGRADDTPEMIKQNLAEHKRLTDELLDFYRPKGVLRTIDANRSEEAIRADVEALLGPPIRKN